MENEIRIAQADFEKKFPDQFARDNIFTRSNGINREYLIDGQWTQENPSQKPDAVNIVFTKKGVLSPQEKLEESTSIYGAWRALMEMSVEEPTQKEAIMDRLSEPIAYAFVNPYLGGKLYLSGMRYWTELFVPWGVRPNGNFGQSEVAALDRIQKVQDELWKNNIASKVLLMPADLYATEVNKQVNPDQVREYFEQVTTEGNNRYFSVVPWSSIREKFMEDYQRLSAELTTRAIQELIPWQVIQSAIKSAGRRSGFTTRAEVQASAFNYLRERLCEAVIIEENYKPIKVSVGAKYKDNFVDRDLPRVYVMPSELQFPWLK